MHSFKAFVFGPVGFSFVCFNYLDPALETNSMFFLILPFFPGLSPSAPTPLFSFVYSFIYLFFCCARDQTLGLAKLDKHSTFELYLQALFSFISFFFSLPPSSQFSLYYGVNI
jgi:hypothetical protein